MLETFGPDIWIAHGHNVSAYAGFHYPTRMAIIRLSDGTLFVWSPISLDDDLRAAVDALGRVRHIVAPNCLHHLFIAEWKAAYRDAIIHAAPGLRKKRTDIVFDADLSDTPASDWVNEIDQLLMTNAITDEIIFFHKKSGTVLFADILQQFPANWFSGWRAIVAKLDLMVGSEPSVPRKFRIGFTNKRVARAALQRILAWPSEKVLIAHGAPVTTGGKAFLARAFRWLNA